MIEQRDKVLTTQTFLGIPITIVSDDIIECAKQFGERFEAQDRDVNVIAYRWNDKIYITGISNRQL
jgi:hypothetical protein